MAKCCAEVHDGQPHTTQEAVMITNEVRSNDATRIASVGRVDMKLEVVVIPVSDVDRAKEFYGNLWCEARRRLPLR